MQAWREGGLPGWEIAAVLTRSKSIEEFFSQGYDLVIEAAGPQALAMHGARALALCDVWTVSGAALADPAVLDALTAAGKQSGHRLRVVAGAICGLDGVAAASVDEDAQLHLAIDLPPSDAPPGVAFSGNVRAAALRFPDGVNVAAAAALAGPGLDRSRIEVMHPGPVPQHRLALTIRSRFGMSSAWSEPRVAPGVHPVAACLIAALRRELQTVWAG